MKWLIENWRKFTNSGLLEAWFWIGAIVALALTNPDSCHHFSLCLFENLGISFCPGCGLGRSIALLFRFRLADSFATHPLAIPTLIILGFRIVTLFKNRKKTIPLINR